MDELIKHAATIRFGFFVGIYCVMALWQFLVSRRDLSITFWRRWLSNLSLMATGIVAVRLLFPFAAMGVAYWVQIQHIGLFHLTSMPYGLSIVLAIVILDLAIYWQHVFFHKIPLFWRFHRVHHVDLDFDVSTGLRFHPVEIILSMLIKFAVIIIFGLPAMGVLAFQIILNATSLFNHTNAWMPLGLDKWVRRFVVTPDMHRVHHSIEWRELNSNFGFNFPWWDRMFKTYRPQPEAGHIGMRIGVKGMQEQRLCINLWEMLKLPFAKNPP